MHVRKGFRGMNKLLTISVAAYNVERYIENTLNSLLTEDIDKLEIIVQDDGGNDGTAEIAQRYQEKYPDSVRLVRKENGGYGSTINSSLMIATGKYFKQLDGDDWFETDNINQLLSVLENNDIDVIYTPHYEVHEYKSKKILRREFPENLKGSYALKEVIGLKRWRLVMHSLCFRTELLTSNNIRLLEKCFYTDSEYSLYPLAYAKDIYICDFPIYNYRLGVEAQSVSAEGRRKHYKDHLEVDKRLVSFYRSAKRVDKQVKEYVRDCISDICASGITDYAMVAVPDKGVKREIISHDIYIKRAANDIYVDMKRKSKVLNILRKSNYRLYGILARYKIWRYRK